MPTRAPIHQPDHIRLRPKRTTTEKEYDQRRGYASARGYGRRWHKVRKLKLARDPLCAECYRHGHTTPAVDVHHLKSRRDYPELAYDMDNLESRCHSCHSTATGEGRVNR